MNEKTFRIILICMFVLCAISVIAECRKAHGAEVSLVWDASASPNIENYKVYYGLAPGSYIGSESAGNAVSYTVKNLIDGKGYCFTVSAINAEGYESGFSNEVCTIDFEQADRVVVYLSGPRPLPMIELVTAPAIGATTVTIIWTTREECDGTAFVWEPDKSETAVKSNNLGTTDHMSTFGGLTSKTHYKYRVESVCDGIFYRSEDRSFNTK